MKQITVERFGVKIVIQYPADMAPEKVKMLEQDALSSCVRIRNKRDE